MKNNWKRISSCWLPALIMVMLFVCARSADEYDLFRELRCPVCPSQSLLESQAPESIQLRETVRTMLAAGLNRDEIRGKLGTLYGPDIFRTPPINWGNSLLWGAPYGLLCIAVARQIYQHQHNK
ncbi:MAG: hypothetical protein CMF43_02390 [Legionellales bacterium]|nr:hypothetical protein [Legionellales bacterium]